MSFLSKKFLRFSIYPVISDILLEVLRIKYEAFGQEMPFIRTGHAPLTRILKRGVSLAKASSVGIMGKFFRRKLKGVPTNLDFTGVYDFCAKTSFADMVPRFLIEVEEGTLMLCHPGMPISSQTSDVHDLRRAEEFNYLASHAFHDVLVSSNLRLRRALL